MAESSDEKIDGRYFAAGSNASSKAILRRRGVLVLITVLEDGGEEGKTFSAGIDHISDRLASVARKIHLEDGSVFEARDNDSIDRMFDLSGGFFSRMSRTESSLKLVAVIAIATLGLLFALYRFGLPALANGAASVTPVTVLTLMDQGTLKSVDKLLFGPSEITEERQQEVSGIFDDLANQSGLKNPPLRLLFRDGGRLGANAIALPGGTMIITDQLIEMAKSDDEIAGVLGHEIGHVELRHSLRQIYRVLGIGFMLSIIGGDSGQLMEDVVAQAAALESLSYSRQFETESDERSAQLMVALGRDPFAFIGLLKRITKDDGKEKKTGWLSTHPGVFDRRATIKEYVDSRLKR